MIKLNRYRDGGTIRVRYSDKEYYIDGRINSDTKGELFTEYPGHVSTQKLPDKEALEVYERMIDLLSEEVKVQSANLSKIVQNKNAIKNRIREDNE